jgi:chemotaxis protein methyltransferase CheR
MDPKMESQLIYNIPRLTDEEFSKFAKLIYNESGIFLKENKLTLLSNRLRKRLKELKITTYAEYYNLITNSENKEEEVHGMLDVVSTNETYFFRNERQFSAFSLILEGMYKDPAKMPSKPLRIWSAGCSTGEEPYTIALVLTIYEHLLRNREIEIIATDISRPVLKIALEGCYGGRRIDKIPPYLLKKYFKQKPGTDDYCVNNSLKKLIKFKSLNLFKDPFPENNDIIFCRNVMIYFDREHQKKLIDGFANVLKPGGYLFVGHAETLYNLSERFVYNRMDETPVYVKVK